MPKTLSCEAQLFRKLTNKLSHTGVLMHILWEVYLIGNLEPLVLEISLEKENNKASLLFEKIGNKNQETSSKTNYCKFVRISSSGSALPSNQFVTNMNVLFLYYEISIERKLLRC